MDDSNLQRAEEIAGNLTALLARAGPLEAADEALALAREGLGLVTRESAPVLWARLHLRIGAVGTVAGYDRGDLAMLREAVASNAAALAVCTREADAATWFNTEHNHALGLVYIGEITGDPEPMERAAARLRTVLRKRPNEVAGRPWANAFNSLGAASQQIGLARGQAQPIRRAIACYRAAARAYRAAGHPEDVRRLAHNTGVAFSMLGDLSGDPADYDRAIAAFEMVRTRMTRERDLREWANVSHSIAQARASRASVTGESAALDAAISECEAIIAAMPRAHYPTWWTMAMVSQSDFKLRRGSLRGDPAGFIGAAEDAQAAFALASAEASPAYWVALMRTATDARLRLGAQTSDPAQIEQAIALAGGVITSDKGGSRERAAMLTLRGRARLMLAALRPEDAAAALTTALGDLDAALSLTDRGEAPALWAAIAQVRAEARSLLGRRARDQETLQSAIEDFRDVLATLPQAVTSQQRGIARAGLARARLALAQTASGDNAAEIAAEFRAALTDLRPDLDIATVIAAGRGEATSLLLAGQWEKAAATAEALLDRAGKYIAAEPTEHARLALAEALAGTGDIAAYAFLRLGQVDRALSSHEQGRAYQLRARLRLAEAALDPSQATEIDRLRRLAGGARRALAQAIEGGTAAAAVERLSAALVRAHRELTDAMTAAGLAVSSPLSDITNPHAIIEGIAAVPIVTPLGGALIVLGVTAETLWLDELTTRAVEDLLAPLDGGGWLGRYALFRDTLAEGSASTSRNAVAAFQESLEHTAQACWLILMGPLDAHLRARGVPDGRAVVGRLSALPLHAAGTAGNAFLDRWAVSYAPSLSALSACRRRASRIPGGSGGLLAITDPGLDLGRVDNPAVAAFPGERVEVLHGPAATRSAVIESLEHAAYVSFFSHAEWNAEHPERSALLLSGGERLTAEDFASLDLARCRMVVLGACESGVPGLRIAADEFRGLPAALLEAGIPGVLATLWPVFTDAADRIIADFFRYHLNEGLSPPQALRRAQLEFRDARIVGAATSAAMGVRRGVGSNGQSASRDLSLPAYWAAFAYIGV